ncbi:MAG: 30S ribosomal protein S5 [archaeon]
MSKEKEIQKPEEEAETAEVVAEAPKEEEIATEVVKSSVDKEAWKPKTGLGRRVKNGEITSVEYILDHGLPILEPEIVDILMPEIETDLLMVGQSKGKFGGGQRRVFKQTQKKTKEGNKPRFATFAVAGNKDGYVGLGYGKSRETVPAREKAIRNAKLNIAKIRRGCGSWQCNCKEPHSIPFKVEGKCGSCVIKLMPAPKGAGLCVESECAKILQLVGIKDIWSKTLGQTNTKINLVQACQKALRLLMLTKVQPKYVKNLSVVEGGVGEKDER